MIVNGLISYNDVPRFQSQFGRPFLNDQLLTASKDMHFFIRSMLSCEIDSEGRLLFHAQLLEAPSEEDEQKERINVRFIIVVIFICHLRRHVSKRSDAFWHCVLHCIDVSESKVDQHNVLKLQVSVNHSVLVDVEHAKCNFNSEFSLQCVV